jgi:hypothetical protein
MFGSDLLDIGIGVALLFLFVSLMCTAAREALEALMKSRSKDLERGIRELLDDRDWTKGLVEEFYKHPLIYSLFDGNYNKAKLANLPSYIPSANFAGALMDMVRDGKLASKFTDQSMLSWVDPWADDLVATKAELAASFDATMDRVSGWYKRRTQIILFFIGLGAAIVLNIDTIAVVKALSTSQALRDAAVAQAEQILSAAEQGDGGASTPPTPEEAPTPPATGGDDAGSAGIQGSNTQLEAGANQALLKLSEESYAELKGRLDAIGYPIGWKDWWPAPQQEQLACGKQATACICKVYIPAAIIVGLGWLITALAVMLGAPFWFDVLNKFMVIRSTVKPREKSQEEGSEDRPLQAAGTTTAAAPAALSGVSANAAMRPPGYVPHTWKSGAEDGLL